MTFYDLKNLFRLLRDHTISEDSVPYSPTVSSGYHTDTERNSEESLAKGHVTSNKGHVTFDEEVEEFIYRDMSKEDKKGLRRVQSTPNRMSNNETDEEDDEVG